MGRSSRGKDFFARSLTSFPRRVSSTASTTLSICDTPSRLTPSKLFDFRSPCGTQPATTMGFPSSLPFAMMFTMACSLGFFTVQVLTSHKSASPRSSTRLYP